MGWKRNCLAESFYFEQKTILTQLVTDLVAATETRLLEYKHLFNVKHAPNDPEGKKQNMHQLPFKVQRRIHFVDVFFIEFKPK